MSINGKKIAFLVVAEGVEQVELTQPWSAVEKDGGQPVLVTGGDENTVQAVNHLDKGDPFDADLPVSRAGVEDYDGLVLPGPASRPTSPMPAATGWIRRSWSTTAVPAR